jgi:RNase P/RNase MRP subunit POP5
MKENKRYLFIEGEDLRGNVEKAILSFIGTLGLSKVALEFIKSNKNSAIISVNREAVNAVRASFAVFPKKIEVKMISGTLKGLKDKI